MIQEVDLDSTGGVSAATAQGLPSAYAFSLAREYAAKASDAHKKELGQFFTPPEIGTYLASLVTPLAGTEARLLDPGFGTGVLACALIERLVQTSPQLAAIWLDAYDVDAGLTPYAQAVLAYLTDWLAGQNIACHAQLTPADFILHHRPLWSRPPAAAQPVYDVVIANPPYFKLSRQDPRNALARQQELEQPNIYALFVVQAALLTKPGGELVFLVPRSFCSGPYFGRFRGFLYQQLRLDVFHLFHSRRKAFEKDAVLQENLIFKATRADHAGERDYPVRVLASEAGHDGQQTTEQRCTLDELVDLGSPEKVLCLPTSAAERRLASSGATTPLQDFQYADASLQSDFLGISDHNHAQAEMQRPNYTKGLQQAEQATNAQFVALYGMEWGVISGGGHVLVYGVDQLLGWEPGNYDVFVARSDYAALFREINKRPGAFATLAHPQAGDYGNLAGAGTAFSPRADSALVGTVLRSGPATSTNTTYSNPSTSSYEGTYQQLLAKGYHVGISLDHDNHNTTFGRTTPGRLVVLAPALTRADLLDALRQRRFYASDDWNAEVSFTLNERPMGSVFADQPAATLQVSVSDPDQEPVAGLVIMRGVAGNGTLATPVVVAAPGSTAVGYADVERVSGAVYYYAVIVQADGDRLMTSPIWYTRQVVTSTAAPGPAGAGRVSQPDRRHGDGLLLSAVRSRRGGRGTRRTRPAGRGPDGRRGAPGGRAAHAAGAGAPLRALYRAPRASRAGGVPQARSGVGGAASAPDLARGDRNASFRPRPTAVHHSPYEPNQHLPRRAYRLRPGALPRRGAAGRCAERTHWAGDGTSGRGAARLPGLSARPAPLRRDQPGANRTVVWTLSGAAAGRRVWLVRVRAAAAQRAARPIGYAGGLLSLRGHAAPATRVVVEFFRPFSLPHDPDHCYRSPSAAAPSPDRPDHYCSLESTAILEVVW